HDPSRQYWYRYDEYSYGYISSHLLWKSYPSHRWFRSGSDHSSSRTDRALHYVPAPYFPRFWKCQADPYPPARPGVTSRQTSACRGRQFHYSGQNYEFYKYTRRLFHPDHP